MKKEAITQLIERYEFTVRENERLIAEITRVQSEHNLMLLKYNARFRPENQDLVELFEKALNEESIEEINEICDEIRVMLYKKYPDSRISQTKIVKDITGMSLSDSKQFIDSDSGRILKSTEKMMDKYDDTFRKLV